MTTKVPAAFSPTYVVTRVPSGTREMAVGGRKQWKITVLLTPVTHTHTAHPAYIVPYLSSVSHFVAPHVARKLNRPLCESGQSTFRDYRDQACLPAFSRNR